MNMRIARFPFLFFSLLFLASFSMFDVLAESGKEAKKNSVKEASKKAVACAFKLTCVTSLSAAIRSLGTGVDMTTGPSLHQSSKVHAKHVAHKAAAAGK